MAASAPAILSARLERMSRVARTCLSALLIVAGASAAATIYGFASSGSFTLAYVFNANFLAGSLLTFVGLFFMVSPALPPRDGFSDHSSYNERFAERYFARKKKGRKFLFLGVLVLLISGLAQMALARAIPAA
ncbi:MAG: hypothetical protein FWE09_05010 [Treponema sp.]|nr:hypothetical protein [Treponema sp.]